MIKCEECAREFKTKQGVAGHMLWVHNRPSQKQLALLTPRRFITNQELIALFKVRDKSMAEVHRVVTDISARTLLLLSNQTELEKKQDEVAERLDKARL